MRILPLTVLILLAAPAYAAQWAIDPASTLTFSGSQAGTAFTGNFTRFTPLVDFDPARPEAGKITVTVDMGSATIDDKDKQDSLPTADWFDTAKYPTATFTSSAIKKIGEHTYEAAGKLTLHGITAPVTLPFTLQEQDSTTVADGRVVLQRNTWQVGQGQWKDDQWIAYPVTVKFHLIARQK